MHNCTVIMDFGQANLLDNVSTDVFKVIHLFAIKEIILPYAFQKQIKSLVSHSRDGLINFSKSLPLMTGQLSRGIENPMMLDE